MGTRLNPKRTARNRSQRRKADRRRTAALAALRRKLRRRSQSALRRSLASRDDQVAMPASRQKLRVCTYPHVYMSRACLERGKGLRVAYWSYGLTKKEGGH